MKNPWYDWELYTKDISSWNRYPYGIIWKLSYNEPGLRNSRERALKLSQIEWLIFLMGEGLLSGGMIKYRDMYGKDMTIEVLEERLYQLATIQI